MVQTGWYLLGLVTGAVITALILEPTGLLQSPAFIGAVIGGVLAITSGWFAQSHVLRNTLKIKMDEAVAQRRVAVNQEAYTNIKKVEGAYIQQSIEQTDELVRGLEPWFFQNALYMPGDFADHWLTARTNIHLLAMHVPNRPVDHTEKLQNKVSAAISAAIGEVWRGAGLSRPEWDSRIHF